MSSKVEIPDAYAEYVRARRESEQEDKIATIKMPVSQVAAIWNVIADTVDAVKDLSPESKKRWESILRSLQRAIHEAE